MKALSKSTRIKLTALVVSLIVIVVGVWLYVAYTHVNPSTDDAYVQANIVYITPQVGGDIKSLPIQDFQIVKKGQLLLEIDPAQYQDALKQATAQWRLQKAQEVADQEAVKVASAQVQEAQANQFVAKQKAGRTVALVKQGLSSPESGDEVTGDLNAQNATVQASQEQVIQAQQNLAVQHMQVKAAYANMLQARLNLKWTKIYAPSDGYVDNLSLRVGSVVTAGQSLFAVVDNTSWWVDANYKESDLDRIHPGQTATIWIDMYPDHAFKGKVAFISRGSGSTFSLLPPENATGNWVKVTQRFVVRIEIPPSEVGSQYPLRVGASATVRINTQG